MAPPQTPTKGSQSGTLSFDSPTSPTTIHMTHSNATTANAGADVSSSDPHAGGFWYSTFGVAPARAEPGWFRREAAQLVGEFLGTFLFLFLAFLSAQAAIGNDEGAAAGKPLAPATLFYVATGFGGGLLVALWVFRGISGEMFNPAITIGLALIRAITPMQALLHIPVQILASICAAALTDALTPGPLLISNGLASNISPARGLFIEALLTAQLVLAVFLLCRPPNPHPLAPMGVALSVFMGHMTGVNFTGTGINPARSFGPDVVSAKFAGTAWVYYVGPVLGALIAVVVFTILKVLEKSSRVQKGNSSKVVRVEDQA